MKKRKVPCLLLALFLAQSLIPAQAYAVEDFSDVAPSAWYYSDVIKARDMGLISGYDDGSFKPENNIRYSEVVKLAACMNEKYSTGEITLPAGEGSPWYKVYVDYAKEKGIISKDYSWTGTATRADVAEIFVNGLPSSALADKNSVAEGYIPDVGISHPQAAQIYRLYRAGILDGKGADHSFKPDARIKRSEISAILTRMMDETARVEVTLGPAPEPEVPGMPEPEVPGTPEPDPIAAEPPEEEDPGELSLIYQTSGGELNYSVRSLPLAVLPYKGKKPYSYQWTRGGVPIEGVQEQFLTVTAAGNYACTVTDAAGASVTSDQMVVTFDPNPPVAIAEHPVDRVIVKGVPDQDTTLTVKADAGHQPYTYQWYAIAHAYHDDYDTLMVDVYKCMMDDEPFKLTFEDTPDYCSPTLDVSKIKLQDDDGNYRYKWHHYHEGVKFEERPDTDISRYWEDPFDAEYFCVVTDRLGQSVQSDTAGCRVVYRNAVTGPVQKNYRQRWFDAYTAGKPDTVSERLRWDVFCRGESFSIQYYKDGVLIPGAGSERYHPWEFDQVLDIKDLGRGTYHAVVHFEPSPYYGGMGEETVTTDDFRWFIDEQPEEAVIPAGGSATLSFTTGAPGRAPFTYQWERADTIIAHVLKDAKRAENSLDILWIDEDEITHEGSFSDVEGATGATLTTDVPATYRCRVTDADGYVNYTTPVFVYEQLKVTEQPVWTNSSDEEVSCRYAGGLWKYEVHIQQYGGAWTEVPIFGGTLDKDYSTGSLSVFTTQVWPRITYSDYAAASLMKTRCGSGVYRFAVHDLFTGQWAYSESFTIPDD
ncbi:MAG: S-layer homology domain-containing protein [Firmicutes bacterium]|nr:S-layer homology domain-containing protein [Bacillota bacterium]